MAKLTDTRIKKVQKRLKEYGVDALVVQSPVDLSYLTGFELSAGTLVITTKTAKLFVDGRYIEKCKTLSPIPAERIDAKSIENFFSKQKGVVTCGFDASWTTYESFSKLEKQCKNIQLISLSKPIEKIRAVKDAKEIAQIKRACLLCEEGFQFICSRIGPNVTEKQLATELEIFWLTNGGDKLSFSPIIAFGANSSMPHYRSQNTKLKSGDAILVDIGVVLNGYASDITRMIYYKAPDKKLVKIRDIVLKAQKEAIRAIKPGVKSDRLHAIAEKVIDKAGYKEAFLHSLGHGIGLEVHEYPYLRSKEAKDSVVLEPGMVVTVEPGIYLPKLGGVRIEDMVLVTKEGHEVLTNCPKFKILM